MRTFFNIIFLIFPFLAISQNSGDFTFSKRKSLPITPVRTLSFTTNEGSFMDVDISPDGKTILFDLLGDLYSVPATGGIAKQLTRGLAINYFPVWSPDGKLIAYSSDASGERRLHIRNVEGSFEKVFDLENPASTNIQIARPKWMPDGQYIAFGDFLYHLTGSKVTLKDAINVRGSFIGYSNDKNYIYTEQRSHDTFFFRRYDVQTWTDTVIYFTKGLSFMGKVSRNGRWLTYLNRLNKDSTALILHDCSNDQNRLLALLKSKSPDFEPDYSFSQDCNYLFIGYEGKIHRINLVSNKNEIVHFKANVHVDMGSRNYNSFRISEDSTKVNYTRSANASPDGKHLLFSALNRLYIMDLPNGKPKIFAPQPFGQFNPVYSPDGQWIAYVSWNDKEGGHVWRIPSTGGEPEQLTQVAARYKNINWSADGKKIVAIKGELRNLSFYEPSYGEIVLINVSNHETQLLADDVPFYSSPSFSSDGVSVIYMTGEPDKKIVEKIISNGFVNVLARIKKNDDALTAFRQMIISPNKKYIIYTENENLFLVPIIFPGQTIIINGKRENLPIIRFAEGAFDPHWEQGGKILSWSFANRYYQVAIDKVIQTAINKSVINRSDYSFVNARVDPDKTIIINLLMPCKYGKGTIMLTNARIITMKGDQVLQKGTIVIKDGRFIAVNESSKISLTKDATVFDFNGKTIMPGIIDAHAHYDNFKRDIFPQQSWILSVNLAYGVTSARIPSAGHDEFGFSELLREGTMLGPRLFSSGQAVRPHYHINDLYEAKSVVNNHLIDKGTFIKQYKLNTRLEKQWLLLASQRAGMNMTNEGDENPLEYLGKIKDGSTGIEHTPLWGKVFKDVITFLSASGAYIVPTLQFCDYVTTPLYFRNKYCRVLDSTLKQFTPATVLEAIYHPVEPKDTIPTFLDDAKIHAKVLHNGGKIVMGSHSEDQGIGAHFEIWALQMGGLTNMEALRCATLTAAEVLGVQKDLGSIEVGKIADLIILNKNPLEDILNTNTIQFVMKDGILYTTGNLSTIWPVQK